MIAPAFHRSFVQRATDAPLRLGFVPLTDSAPLIVAQEFGLFARRGFRVKLTRELGWASVRDKLVHGELDAAHAPCGLPFALTLGLGCVPTECFTSLVLNLHGNAITLSQTLREEGVTDANSLARFIRRQRSIRTLVFGVVSLHSTHAWLLQTWLARAGIDPEREVRLVVVPPPQMSANLRSGNLDGFCAGEPWNTVAIHRGDGWCAAMSCDLAPGHPEKVLALRGDVFRAQPERMLDLTAALLEAALACSVPENQDAIVRLLARREYLGLPVDQIRPAWTGELPLGTGGRGPRPDFLVFHRDDSNDPSADKAGWVAQHLLNPVVRAQLPPVQLGRVFRSDLFAQARERLLSPPHLTACETSSIPV